MKKFNLFIILFMVAASTVYSQWDLSVAMGVDFKSAPKYRDYVNAVYGPYGKKLSTFSSAGNFSIELDYAGFKDFQPGIEYSLLIDSYNISLQGGANELSYFIHRPSLLGFYKIEGEGYKFKFGLGAGLRIVEFTEKIITATSYRSSGFGIVLKAEGISKIDGKLFVSVGFDLRYDSFDELYNEELDKKIINYATGEAVDLNSVSAGIKLGIVYTF
ncbi:hypothetical protein MROS_1732 [Melioribacter roseus P3M-2]|uniref:Outer membrane protein beta-barrel domain-containing protein n=1 Tax=Melioribacter roseus (strain DSM 23840 / JCM 17771 / VKM B-2668 / P3M-2) TaxID=1191523 RepID=I7A516_MELRP|nr:hypothetical protein [Melioribacter roseus]AFN74966.1 hypothetical protein MROS_1732 [Melioribacter roseus P3M-2]